MQLTPYFQARTEKRGDCAVWTRHTTADGYGTCKFKGKLWFAHRLSWSMHYGDIPSGLHVLHKCDNPQCVNPEHLFIGTNLDNIKDCKAKGRYALPMRGSSHGHYKHGRYCS